MARLGLLSDSHGNTQATHRGAQILANDNAEILLHLGDIGTTDVIDAMLVQSPISQAAIPVRLVFGNTDYDTAALRQHAERHGMIIDHPAGSISFKKRSLVYTHGDNFSILQDALARKVSYFCHGHTHQQLDTYNGSTRIINPGALFRASRYTVAILDTEADEVLFHPVDH